MEKPKDVLFDNRIVRRHVEKGLTTQEEYQKYLKSLPDEKANSEEIPYEDPEDTIENTEEVA